MLGGANIVELVNALKDQTDNLSEVRAVGEHRKGAFSKQFPGASLDEARRVPGGWEGRVHLSPDCDDVDPEIVSEFEGTGA